MRPYQPLRAARLTRKFRPGFEALEDRTTPAVTVTNVAGVLTITGDAPTTGNVASVDDTVLVRAVGNDTFTVEANGVTGTTATQTEMNVQRIVVNLGQGTNTFTLDVTLDADVALEYTAGSETDRVRVGSSDAITGQERLDLSVSLGTGNDSFILRTEGVRQDARLTLFLDVGVGNDSAAAILAGVGTSLTGGIGENAQVNVNMNGGAGSDQFGISAGNGVFGDATLRVRVNTDTPASGTGQTAADGNDSVRVGLGNIGITPSTGGGGGTGQVPQANEQSAIVLVDVDLGGGNDFLRTVLADVGQNAVVSLRHRAAAGNDVIGVNFGTPITGGATGTTGTASPPDITLDIDLGDGDDRFILALAEGSTGGTTEVDALLRVFLEGGLGRDIAFFDLPETDGDDMINLLAFRVEAIIGTTNDASTGTTGTTGTTT